MYVCMYRYRGYILFLKGGYVIPDLGPFQETALIQGIGV